MKSIIIFDFMIKDLNLKGSELLIYALIYSFSQFCQVCFMKPETMAKCLGLSRSQVYRAIDILKRRNFIYYRDNGLMANCNDIYSDAIDETLENMIRIAKTPWLDI